MSLATDFAGVEFKNPIVAASGTFGFGREYGEFYDLSQLGGICVSGITVSERLGNAPPRIAETSMGMLNSVGLQNPGVDAFIRDELPFLRKLDTVIIANVSGTTLEEYVIMTEKLSDAKLDILEINVSCPNVKEGGMQFGVCGKSVFEITKEVKSRSSVPVMIKLTPNVTNIAEIAKAAEDAGADAVSLINTVLGMRIDINTRKPVLSNNVGGLSGPAILPIAVRMVWQVAQAVKIPIMGMGGVTKSEDAIEMMLAGAKVVGVGTANFIDPYIPVKIIEQLNNYRKSNKINNINEIVGKVNLN